LGRHGCTNGLGRIFVKSGQERLSAYRFEFVKNFAAWCGRSQNENSLGGRKVACFARTGIDMVL